VPFALRVTERGLFLLALLTLSLTCSAVVEAWEILVQEVLALSHLLHLLRGR